MTEPDDNTTKALAELSPHDVAPETRRRILREMNQTRDDKNKPLWNLVARKSLRFATPVLLAGTVGIYLTWAVRVAVSVMP